MSASRPQMATLGGRTDCTKQESGRCGKGKAYNQITKCRWRNDGWVWRTSGEMKARVSCAVWDAKIKRRPRAKEKKESFERMRKEPGSLGRVWNSYKDQCEVGSMPLPFLAPLSSFPGDTIFHFPIFSPSLLSHGHSSLITPPCITVPKIIQKQCPLSLLKSTGRTPNTTIHPTCTSRHTSHLRWRRCPAQPHTHPDSDHARRSIRTSHTHPNAARVSTCVTLLRHLRGDVIRIRIAFSMVIFVVAL